MPYWRLSGFYFFYFSLIGVLAPYWGLYLQSVGFGPIAIGQLTALLMVSRTIAPLVWGWAADRGEQRMRVVRFTSAAAAIAFIGIFFTTDFYALALLTLAFSFFFNAALPLLDVTTMNHAGPTPGAYGRVRLWGSLGFIAAVLVVGRLIDAQGAHWVPSALLTILVIVWFCSLSLPDASAALGSDRPVALRRVLFRPEVLTFLAACALMQLSHGPYNTFYSIFLTDYGYRKSLIGELWALGVICEIGIFLVMQQTLQRVEVRTVLLASALLAVLRWLLIGFFADSLAVLVFAQTLHAATFGAFHAVAIQLVHHFFTGRHQHRGQAIYGSVSFGIGGIAGSFCSGYAWSVLGPTATFVGAAVAALAAFVVAFVGLKPRS
jgi:MFS transporter, PPP family, 3-phenylpropionic acid transporter